MCINKIIETIQIPGYMNTVLISKKRRAKYYKPGDHIPNKYCNNNYKFIDDALVNLKTNERVVKNPISAGTPQEKRITGQDIWVGMNPFVRNKISHDLKTYLYGKVRHVKYIEKYPIGISIEFHHVIGDYDLDNLAVFYRKCLHDALCGKVDYRKADDGSWYYDLMKYPPIIKDDSVRYIRSIPTDFHEVESEDQRKMVITLFHL